MRLETLRSSPCPPCARSSTTGCGSPRSPPARGDAAALARACDWVCERIEAAGGSAEAVRIDGGHPMAIGELRCLARGRPTVLVLRALRRAGAGPLEAWDSPPFEPTERDGRLYARGAADDKGNFLPLLHVACELARAGELPVNVRFLVEGEEEVGSRVGARSASREGEDEADCAIVFDSLMVDERTPAITLGSARARAGERRGAHRAARPALGPLRRRRAERGPRAAWRCSPQVAPDAAGRVRVPSSPPGWRRCAPEERESWERLPPGARGDRRGRRGRGGARGRRASSTSAPAPRPRST